jgi:hypothetical protein
MGTIRIKKIKPKVIGLTTRPRMSPNRNHSFVIRLRDFGIAIETRKKVPLRIKRNWPRKIDLMKIR